MAEYLQVKIKSLAAEAAIIRASERKAKARKNTDLLCGLANHRRNEVRKEVRSSLLAYGFIRGIPYRRIEAFSYEQPHWSRIEELARKYGWQTLGTDKRIIAQKFEEWKTTAPLAA